jgi:hypothetical protein
VNIFHLQIFEDGESCYSKVKSTICVCCGEPMISGGGILSRDPNLCASCSSLGDGMLDELVQAAVMKLAADQENAAGVERHPATEVEEKILTTHGS